MRISGIHHVTAIASDPQQNLDFYTGVLGLRFVKRTVNFDDPSVYHFYFGDEAGAPGTILTFFPWPGAMRGRQGSGFQTATAWIVPAGSLPAWAERLAALGVVIGEASDRFGEKFLAFEDHDGARLELVETRDAASMPFDPHAGVDGAIAVRGFHSVTLCEEGHQSTAALLTSVMGLEAAGVEGGRFRYRTAASSGPGRIVDVVCAPERERGRLGAGVVHHVAFRAADEAEQGRWQSLLAAKGFNVTPVMDRSYFREPGGVLFEIATDTPGFATDEPAHGLGQSLRLPKQYEARRAAIEARLTPLRVPTARPPR